MPWIIIAPVGALLAYYLYLKSKAAPTAGATYTPPGGGYVPPPPTTGTAWVPVPQSSLPNGMITGMLFFSEAMQGAGTPAWNPSVASSTLPLNAAIAPSATATGPVLAQDGHFYAVDANGQWYRY